MSPPLSDRTSRSATGPETDDGQPFWCSERWIAKALAIPDLAILSLGLLIGCKVRFGSWLVDHALWWDGVTPIVLTTYAAALVASGVYTMSPRSMHLTEFLRVGGYLVGAWGASIAVAYIMVPDQLPPRSVMGVQGLVALVGILGTRALVRRSLEERSRGPAPPSPPPNTSLHDLLARDPVRISRTNLRDHLSGRTVLVTGAGGSIGSELTSQLAAMNPFRIVAVDVSEYNLYQLEKQLRSSSYDGALEFCIADVRDEPIMDGLFERFRPDVVLHTAAYKHVPLMERHPVEAFRNNTMATVHLLDLCEQHRVEQFVFVSTDKAVDPASVLGATKQLAEWYVRAGTSDVKRKVVRFGNVFGSQGSVVPLFEEQLADGRPLTVTHPEMERYFMSVHEACSLILQTVLHDAFPTYILRMGEPVRIEWLARQLIERWYPQIDPSSMIEYVGRRPGEKLSEQLVMAHETAEPTDHPGIAGLRGEVPYGRSQLKAHFHHLQELALDHKDEELRKALSVEGPHCTQPRGIELQASSPLSSPSSSSNGSAISPSDLSSHRSSASSNGGAANESAVDGRPEALPANNEAASRREVSGATDDRSNGYTSRDSR
jgi:FlaA1/EpsC-like NDP-sugar epimerase